MPQQLHVVRCYNCEIFQVDIVKKIPKWTCKLCGEKQSLRKVYGTGTGKECRVFVQDLNKQRHTLQTSLVNKTPGISETKNEEHDESPEYIHDNKWSEYMSKNVDDVSDEDTKSNYNIRSTISNVNSKFDCNQSNTRGMSCESNSATMSSNSLNAIELNNKWTAFNDIQCDDYEEKLVTKLNPNVEVSKRKFSSDNIENKFGTWKKFLSNEEYDSASCLKTKEPDKVQKKETAEFNKTNKIYNIYENRFGEDCNLDIDLEF